MKILFVCHGNICRSPMAEFIFKDMVIKAGYTVAGLNGATTDNADFVIQSAATSREELGNPVYPPAKRKLAEHDIGVPDNELGVGAKRARQINQTDLDYYDLIICMDYNNLRNMRRMFGDAIDEPAKIPDGSAFIGVGDANYSTAFGGVGVTNPATAISSVSANGLNPVADTSTGQDGMHPLKKVALMLDFAGRPNDEVADPWYTGDFTATWDDLLESCQGLIAQFK